MCPGTLYHVRAYATNSSGTAYGDDLTFNTLAVVPIITTMAVTDITQTSATSGGNISSDGGSSVTARGVCWGTTSNPIITGSHTSDGTGSGVYISNLNGLDLNTVYYVRAYAINSVGIAYGVVVSFTTIPILVATLTTDEVISITETSAVSGGNITDDGGAFITERGICWSTEGNPTVSNDKTIDGSGTGSFTSNLTGLPCGRTYYVRAYAVNSAGIAYGSQRSFTTKMFPTVFNPNLTYGSVSDIDENLYKTIQIGNQIWMAENLRTNKYSDGTIIPNVTNDMEWRNLITGAYCWFNHDETTYKATYGALYNWFAVNTGKLCPTGWHVPSDGDWATLSTYLGGDLIAGGKMKEKDTTHWVSPNISADNSSGFTALPGGNRENYGAFLAGVGLVGYWWRSSERVGTDYAWIVSISNIYSSLTRGNSYKKTQGFSVRCIKD
ncbi:MAG: hypothetical protein A2Y71_03965 [Bacteroidetes bacterium RBG_13_42_15]|nr:MAG: hypothetical protein A2Y71_03965 [Bacteroidetes bacterium RBG_13_42_15]